MTAGPGDQGSADAAARGYLRASNADREHVIDVLKPMSNAAKAGTCVVIAVAVAVIVSIPTGGAALFVFAPFYFMALLVAGAQILASRQEKRSRREQLPPRASAVRSNARG